MNDWTVHIRTFRPISALPQVNIVACETRQSPDYHLDGRYRKAEEGRFFFQYTLSGTGYYRDANGEYHLRRGEGFLCRNSDESVAYGYPEGATEPWSFIWFGFIGNGAAELVESLNRSNGSIYSLDPEDALLEPFLSYKNMNGLTLDLNAASSARIVYDFLLGLVDMTMPDTTEDGHTIIAQKAMRYVRENISGDINANDISCYLDLSREHFTRVFKEQTGFTPYQYILRQKMLRACRYLKETDLSQKEIALKVGYSEVANFSRSFTRFVKLSPGNYRKHGNPTIE